MRTLATATLMLATACAEPVENEASEPTQAPTTGNEAVEPGIAEVPFRAEEIRAATLPGRTYVVEMREGDAEPQREVWTFEESTDEGFVLVVRDLDDVELRRSEGPWTELESHAHFPAELTTIGNTELSSELGTRACRLYEVRDPDDANVVRRFWFATDLPGAPIRMVVENGGEMVMEMKIVEHRPGST